MDNEGTRFAGLSVAHHHGAKPQLRLHAHGWEDTETFAVVSSGTEQRHNLFALYAVDADRPMTPASPRTYSGLSDAAGYAER